MEPFFFVAFTILFLAGPPYAVYRITRIRESEAKIEKFNSVSD